MRAKVSIARAIEWGGRLRWVRIPPVIRQGGALLPAARLPIVQVGPLRADRGVVAVAWVDPGLVGEREEPPFQALHVYLTREQRAATVLEHGLQLVTHNARDFNGIKGLRVRERL